MKSKLFFLSLFTSLALAIPAVAQIKPADNNNTINPPVTQCNDGFDNDGDKLIDTAGGTINGTTVAKDPQCTSASIQCENGTTTCLNTVPSSAATDFNLQVKIKNPLKVDSIEGAIQLFMNALLRLALPVIIVFFIWSGLNFILARGNPDKIKVAKNMFWYTIIGTLLILGAWTITNIIIGTVNSITG